jgi:hypothetical protein
MLKLKRILKWMAGMQYAIWKKDTRAEKSWSSCNNKSANSTEELK